MSLHLCSTDHNSLEEFVRALAKATEYKSWDAGPHLSMYWKEEAEVWVAKIDHERREDALAALKNSTK